MDGPFYVEHLKPYSVQTQVSVTLTATLQILCPGAVIPQLPANFFGFPGKTVRVRVMGTCTSAATPGNLDFQINYGAATNNTGINIAGVNVGWAANQAGTTYIAEFFIRCRSIGTSGTLIGAGLLFIQNTGLVGMPPFGPTVSTVDTTTANYLIPQVSRSGSTAETITMFEYTMEALN